MINGLVHSSHQSLHSISIDVPFQENVDVLIAFMWEVMYTSNGVGLAANQVSSSQRVIVVDANGFHQTFINPVITKRYGGKVTSREGCLSFPGLIIPVVRDRQIIVEGLDQNWKPVKRKLKGLAAMCVQHEIDHLNGITLEDHKK